MIFKRNKAFTKAKQRNFFYEIWQTVIQGNCLVVKTALNQKGTVLENTKVFLVILQ